MWMEVLVISVCWSYCKSGRDQRCRETAELKTQ